jgi:integrase
VVPRVGLIVKPGTGRLAFYRALRGASGATVTPYDLRRSYSQWLEAAGVHPHRLRYYMGHGPRDVTQHYQRLREVQPFLADDAGRLGALVGEAVALRVVR